VQTQFSSNASPHDWALRARRLFELSDDQAFVDVERHITLDLSLQLVRVPLPGLAGLLVLKRAPFDGTVFVQSEDPLERQRFTLAHELKHLLVDVPNGLVREDDGVLFHSDASETIGAGLWSTVSNIETSADQFASEFLLAQQPFTEMLDGKPMGVGLLGEVAKAFGVSVTATATRWAMCSEGRCALLEIREGRLYRFVVSPGLEATPKRSRWLQVKAAISDRTRSAAWLRGELDFNLGAPTRIPAKEWLQGAAAGQELCEEVLHVPLGDRLYALIWFPEDFD